MVQGSSKKEEVVLIESDVEHPAVGVIKQALVDEGFMDNYTDDEKLEHERLQNEIKESIDNRNQSANVDAVMRVRGLVENKMDNLESKREKHRRSSNMYIALDAQILHWARFSASLSTLIEDL